MGAIVIEKEKSMKSCARFLVSFCCVLLLFFVTSVYGRATGEKSFVVIITSYNNIQWYKKNLDTLMAQEKTYSNWRAIYVDDCSLDGTGAAVEQYVRECGFDHKITVIRNKQRCGAMENLYRAIYSCSDDEIICTHDGDDWFVVDNLFCILNDLYADANVWLTYGQYREWPSGRLGRCRPMPQVVIEHNAYRKIPWITSQLRTFYAWLFKKIKKEDLMSGEEFFSVTWDQAMMFPMLEMAGGRIRFNPIVVYEYNLDNPINDWKKDLDFVLRTEAFIRKKMPYKRLEGPCKHCKDRLYQGV